MVTMTREEKKTFCDCLNHPEWFGKGKHCKNCPNFISPHTEDVKNYEKITRLEVIDHTKTFEEGGGRILVEYLKENQRIELSEQDEGRTLKIFIKEL